MNIDTISAGRYLNYDSAMRKHQSSAEDEKQKDFQSKLLELRIDHRIKQMDISEKKDNVNIAQPQGKPSYLGTGNPLLFNAWDSGMPIDDALEALEVNLSKIGDFSLSSGISVQEAIEHIASQHSIYKAQIAKDGNAEQLKNLNKMIEKHTESLAKSFSEAIGGFFEDNGAAGERKRMYDSIKGRISFLSSSYDLYISRHKEAFEAITQAAANGQKSLAFELRIAYKEKQYDMETNTKDRYIYTRAELTEAVKLVKKAEGLMKRGEGDIVSEEELGIKLGTIVLEGLSFLQGSSSGGGHKEAFLNAIGVRLNQLMDESDSLLAIQKEKNASPHLYEPLDRSAVLSLVKTMAEHYCATGSAERALKIGIEHGLSSYLAKTDSSHLLQRYRSSDYWDNQLSKLSSAQTGEKKRGYEASAPIFDIPIDALFKSAAINLRA